MNTNGEEDGLGKGGGGVIVLARHNTTGFEKLL